MADLEKIWLGKCREKIRAAVREAGRISMRDLQRKTNHSRAAKGIAEPVAVWFQALNDLEQRKEIVCEVAGGEKVSAFDVEYRRRSWVKWAGKAVMT